LLNNKLISVYCSKAQGYSCAFPDAVLPVLADTISPVETVGGAVFLLLFHFTKIAEAINFCAIERDFYKDKSATWECLLTLSLHPGR
jgi:hypothetical protein